MTARFAYDDVPYDTEANPDAHPGALCTLARLFGIDAANASRARVLEIGCGDGEHALAAASYLPEARFVGFDLAASAIEQGRAAAAALGLANVELLHRDVREVRRAPLGVFDYVVAHGVYSWVPEPVRADVLAVLRDALAPQGVGFVSVNARPGWELRRALREILRARAAAFEAPAAKVQAALSAATELARAGDDGGFLGALAAHAAAWLEHVRRATPPEAPFSRYVFHDLLADENEAFDVEELAARLEAAGLAIVCEAPLRPFRGDPATAGTPSALAEDMLRSGAPFLQVLVCRAEAARLAAPDPRAVERAWLWADLTPAGPGAYRTSTGALVRPAGDDGLARAPRFAPGQVAVRELADDEASRARVARDLLAAHADGVLTLLAEPAPFLASAPPAPKVTVHVRARAHAALERGAASVVLTSAVHRSYRVPWVEAAVVRELDGAHALAEVVERTEDTLARGPRDRAGALAGAPRTAIEAHVASVLDRFTRHAFLVS